MSSLAKPESQVVGFAMWYAQPRPAAPAEQGDELGGYSTNPLPGPGHGGGKAADG